MGGHQISDEQLSSRDDFQPSLCLFLNIVMWWGIFILTMAAFKWSKYWPIYNWIAWPHYVWVAVSVPLKDGSVLVFKGSSTNGNDHWPRFNNCGQFTRPFDKYFLPRLCTYIMLLFLKGCLHVRFCALRLISWSMYFTQKSVEDKLQRITSGYLDALDCRKFITYSRMTIATCKIACISWPFNTVHYLWNRTFNWKCDRKYTSL